MKNIEEVDRIRVTLIYITIPPSRKQAFGELYAQYDQDSKNNYN